MGTLLVMQDGVISIIFILIFFGLVFVLAKLSRNKPKYRQREDLLKERKIKGLKQELEKLEKKK
jgi:uncharacterized membrane protein